MTLWEDAPRTHHGRLPGRKGGARPRPPACPPSDTVTGMTQVGAHLEQDL